MPHSKDAQTQVGLSYNFHGILSQCIVIFLFCVHIVVECEIGCRVSILDFFKRGLLFFIHGNYGLAKRAVHCLTQWKVDRNKLRIRLIPYWKNYSFSLILMVEIGKNMALVRKFDLLAISGFPVDKELINFILRYNFSNFSCMFLNPNIFFQFEFWFF